MRKLQIVSDLHLEMRSDIPALVKVGDDLALLGDIGNPSTSKYKQFIIQQAQRFDHVFIVIGNHEMYNKTATETELLIRELEMANIHVLQRNSFEYTEHTTIIGATLWSLINDRAAAYLNDFRKIKASKVPYKRFTPETYRDWHRRDVKWIDEFISNCNKNVVVLTHHGPCPQMSGKYEGNDLCSGFVSDLRHLFKPPVIAWASGHVHSNVDVEINGIRSVSNAYGYPGEDSGYKEDVVIECP